ncbi:Glucan 1,3-beta-glucosidase OS=Cochliobolus carbonum GN=EXG1 PE=1 SV=1 [Rhizoctonia solani AG-1 IB]|uniref:Glucan 1,3-beta-glucosidase n=1 Tax=Thanatephorus cucumeris (strain AG1-IB / isolate 7/3/14) TaxID=1108050 RepID=A0A0B7FJI6_THACB|nr:Glucan 1,3-beta-glucosidase OS=Cochliobolus carbonum GN=EXG1 PE=1 SV=1 [Rhizoctonia solani AG-1 IB]
MVLLPKRTLSAFVLFGVTGLLSSSPVIASEAGVGVSVGADIDPTSILDLSLDLDLDLTLGGGDKRCSTRGTAKPSDPYWVEAIKHRGSAPYSDNPVGYKVYRNVKDYGAKGDGTTDDTEAIQRAIAEGGRCGQGCEATTRTPALVYFPSGKYLISKPIAAYYYSSMVGNPKDLPVLIASDNFNNGSDGSVLDANPYTPEGNNWYINQNNFFRSIRNFVIDTRQAPHNATVRGVHWQLSQATTLTNLRIEMSKQSGTKQQGIFIENGSGGFMADLHLVGGQSGLAVGNQQFTVRNVTIEDADIAVDQFWNWAWTFQNLKIRNCRVGFNVPPNVGSDLILDTTFENTQIAVQSGGVTGTSNTTFIFDNVEFKNVASGFVDGNKTVLLSGGDKVVKQWIRGNTYEGSNTALAYRTGEVNGVRKSPKLLDSSGKIFSKRRPEYEDYSADQFISVKQFGAKGDGVADDTRIIQAVINKFSGCKIIYFDAGTYYVTDTIKIPEGTIIVGEIWSVIIGGGKKFADQKNPRAVIDVGKVGDNKPVQISNMVLSARSGSAGAIVIRWNVGEPSRQEDMSGMWDVHIRLGGFTGSGVQVNNCLASNAKQPVDECTVAFLAMHLTEKAALYYEGGWVWTADHDLDDPTQRQIDVYSGRGILIESCGPVWLTGSGSEHHVIYQYNIVGAKNVYMGLIQTETPYWQPEPAPPAPFSLSKAYKDPELTAGPAAWSVVISKSSQVYIYGAGLYNFFQHYSQACLANYTCQSQIINVDKHSTDIGIFSLSTVGLTHMLSVDSTPVINQNDNRNGFQSNTARWVSGAY